MSAGIHYFVLLLPSLVYSLEDFLLQYTVVMSLVVNVQSVVESDRYRAQYSMVDCLL